MSVMMKCHLKAFSNAIELLTIAGALGLATDVVWMLHDIHSNGMSLSYGLLITGLITATVITIYAGIVHHKENVRCERDWHMKHKLMIQKSKAKHRKHLEIVK